MSFQHEKEACWVLSVWGSKALFVFAILHTPKRADLQSCFRGQPLENQIQLATQPPVFGVNNPSVVMKVLSFLWRWWYDSNSAQRFLIFGGDVAAAEVFFLSYRTMDGRRDGRQPPRNTTHDEDHKMPTPSVVRTEEAENETRNGQENTHESSRRRSKLTKGHHVVPGTGSGVS